MGVAEQLIRELRDDEEKRRSLARLLVPEVYGDQELRGAVLNAVYRDIATKEDLASLRRELREEFARLEARIDGLLKWVIGMLVSMWVTLAAVLLASVLR